MTPDSPVRVCPKCGRSILAEAEFCPHCGARSERPRRSGFTVLLDWLLTVGVVMLALVFGLAGTCLVVIGIGRFKLTELPNAVVLLALGIGLLMAARALLKYLPRIWDDHK